MILLTSRTLRKITMSLALGWNRVVVMLLRAEGVAGAVGACGGTRRSALETLISVLLWETKHSPLTRGLLHGFLINTWQRPLVCKRHVSRGGRAKSSFRYFQCYSAPLVLRLSKYISLSQKFAIRDGNNPQTRPDPTRVWRAKPSLTSFG